MKKGKTSGVDEIPIELIVEGGEMVQEKILELFNELYRAGEIPDEWGKTIIVPIFKMKGDAGKCENYRGIALIPHVTKLYERIIEGRTRARVEPILGEEQHGYRKNRSVTDLIFGLRIVMEKSWDFNQSLYIAFIDLQKAFDSIPRERLWEC